jgi:hypothetical protein
MGLTLSVSSTDSVSCQTDRWTQVIRSTHLLARLGTAIQVSLFLARLDGEAEIAQAIAKTLAISAMAMWLLVRRLALQSEW